MHMMGTRRLLAVVMASGTCVAAARPQVMVGTQLTLYPGDGEGAPAWIQQDRRLTLHAGKQTVWLGELAQRLDAGALMLRFAGDSGVHLASIAVPPAKRGVQALMAEALGKPIKVLGSGGEVLASGTLVQIQDGQLLVRQGNGTIRLVSGAVELPAGVGWPAPGARARVSLDAARAGAYTAQLAYPSAGLGWHAGYSLVLAPGHECRATLQARAVIVNQSGTDFRDAIVTLLAGTIHQPGRLAPPFMMAAALPAQPAPGIPAQGDLAGYRRYALPQRLTLADGVTIQEPLYPGASLDCTRELVLGQRRSPAYPESKPYFLPGPEQGALGAPRIELSLRAPHNLPAGSIRVFQADADGAVHFIGGDMLPDLRRDDRARIVLGNTYELRALRTRTAWHLAGPVLTEGLRVRLSNRGPRAEHVILYVHPDRWRNWHLVEASLRPRQMDPDTLVWSIPVAAHGESTLDYTLRYDATPVTGPAGQNP